MMLAMDSQHQQRPLHLQMGSLGETPSMDSKHADFPVMDTSGEADLCRSPTTMAMALPLTANRKEGEETTHRRGGWKTMPYIIGNEACEKLATIGLLSNMIVYLTTQFNMTNVMASNVINIWSGTTNFSPLLGAFLSDSYIGRYWTIALGCISSLIGMVLLNATAIFPGLRPPPCSITEEGKEFCVDASPGQNAVLYLSFLMMTIGAGGIRPCSIAFGADQFDYTSKDGQRSIQSFFNWYYFSFTVAVMISLTIIVYIQGSVSWSWGMGIPVSLMFCSVTCFLVGRKLYIRIKPEGSSFTSFAQVIVAAKKKRHLQLPSMEAAEDYYDPPMKGALKSRLPLTNQFLVLNKAAIKSKEDFREDGSVADRWKICSLQQVEELKSVIRIFPIWLAGINIFLCTAQLNTFSILQAATMDRHMSKTFEIPQGTFGVFTMITLTIFLPIYDRIIVPYSMRMTKSGKGITLLQRIGVGYVLNIISIALAAIIETKRRNVAIAHGLMDKPKAIIPMSAFWLVPQFSVAGLAEACSSIGIIEFLYSQFPENMRSVASALFFLNLGVGNYASSLLVNIVHKSTGGQHNWLAQNMNEGKLHYFYWLLTILAAVNLAYFVICARWYRYKTTVAVELEESVEPHTHENGNVPSQV